MTVTHTVDGTNTERLSQRNMDNIETVIIDGESYDVTQPVSFTVENDIEKVGSDIHRTVFQRIRGTEVTVTHGHGSITQYIRQSGAQVRLDGDTLVIGKTGEGDSS